MPTRRPILPSRVEVVSGGLLLDEPLGGEQEHREHSFAGGERRGL